MAGSYSSRKMGVTIQFESHKNELPNIYLKEHKKKTLEFYNQPRPVKLNFRGVDGRNLGFMHTPDFFVIEDDGAGWEECKPEEKLLELEAQNPNRYCRDEEGRWHCPPGEAAAAEYGFFYRVVSSKEIDWTLQRNLEFLDDYFRVDASAVSAAAREAVLTQVSQKPGLSLEELCNLTGGTANRDDIFLLIAHEEVFVDLYKVALVETEYVKVYPDETTALAYASVLEVPYSALVHAPAYVDIKHGTPVNWNGNVWKIVNAGDGLVGMLAGDNAFTELPLAVFEQLVAGGRIAGVQRESAPQTHPEVERLLAQAEKEDLAEANRRVEIVRAALRGEQVAEGVPQSTLDRWKREYRRAEQKYKCGYVGLLPKPRKGNRNPKISPESQDFMERFVEDKYETLKRMRKYSAYALYLGECNKEEIKNKGVKAATYKTWCRAVKRRPKYEQTKKMRGDRAAYKVKEFYMELEFTTPRHGERPLHIGHIDHTEGDAEFICARTGVNLGRPWVTYLTDAYSRRLLAKVMSFDPPSYRACMRVVRECVRRFGRMPQIVIVDGGLEFSGVYFETLLARYECTKKERTGKPNCGSTQERLFGTTNTQFWHNLQGNTQSTRDVRLLTKATDPKRHAIWTLEAADQKLTEWAYEFYDTTPHPALEGQTPREAFNDGMRRYGERSHRLIAYDDHFRMMTLPTTAKGTAKVQVNGVKINNRYYWADVFRLPDVAGKTIPVRFDPWDAGIAYAYALGKWTACRSEKYSVFRGRSEREIMLATTLLRRKDKLHGQGRQLTTARLAAFLQSVEAEEALLRQQLADRAGRSAWEALQAYPRLVKNGDDAQPGSSETVVAAPGDTRLGEVPSAEVPGPRPALRTYGDF